MAMGARMAWSRTAALCPAEVFPEATVRAAVSQYRASRLATAQGREAWLAHGDFFNNPSAVLAAARSACGDESSALNLESRSDSSTSGDGSSCVSPSNTQPSQIIGATSDELNAIASAYDRAAFVMTYRNAQNSSAADLAIASSYLRNAADYAAMVNLGGGQNTRSGVYSTQTIRSMADQVTDPATGYPMAVGTSVSLDLVIEALSTISSTASSPQSSESSTPSASSTSASTADASGTVRTGLSYTTQTVTVSGSAYEPDADGSTDPSRGLASPASRRRAISEELSSMLLDCFKAGVPAREDVILG